MNEDDIAPLFEGVESDPETPINFVFYQEAGGMPVRVEYWTFSGIDAFSMVLRNEDAAGMSDDDLKALVDNSSGVTLHRGDNFTHVNFGFKLRNG